MVPRGRHRVAVLGLLVAAACTRTWSAALSRFEFAQPHMGTQFRIVVYAPDPATASRASDVAFRRIRALDDTMSDYQSGSELMVLCRKAGGAPVRVSDDLFRVLEKSQELAERTHGAFDVTVGPAVRVWRRARRRGELPDPNDLRRARRLVGYKYLRLDPSARTVQLLKRGMRLDLGGIGKGFAADEALVVLQREGIDSALVAAGGDIAASAPPPGKEGWRIGIAPLDSPSKPPTRFLLLRDAGVSTSGDAEQFMELGGTRYSHIIDPRTGWALTGRRSVTVVAPNATTSDAMATAVSVLGPDEGLALVKSQEGVSLLLVQETGGVIRSVEWGSLPWATSAAPTGLAER